MVYHTCNFEIQTLLESQLARAYCQLYEVDGQGERECRDHRALGFITRGTVIMGASIVLLDLVFPYVLFEPFLQNHSGQEFGMDKLNKLYQIKNTLAKKHVLRS